MHVLALFEVGGTRPLMSIARVSRGVCVVKDDKGTEIVQVGGTAKAGEAEKDRTDLRAQVAAYFGKESPAPRKDEPPAKAPYDVRDHIVNYLNKVAPNDE